MGMASTKDSCGDNVMVGIVVSWSGSHGQDQGLGLGSGIIAQCVHCSVYCSEYKIELYMIPSNIVLLFINSLGPRKQ